MTAVLTGSRVYGNPRKATPTDPGSDWDLVVLVSEETREELLGAFQGEGSSCAGSIKVGNLNLVLVTTLLDLSTWGEGTELLKAKAPVARAEAVRLFTMLRARDKAAKVWGM